MHLARHFERSGASTEQWMELISDGRRGAWERSGEGRLGFATDIRAAWRSVQSNQLSGSIAAQWRCAVMLSSMQSVSSQQLATLLLAAANSGALAPAVAAERAMGAEGGVDTIAALLSLSLHASLDASSANALVRRAVELGSELQDRSLKDKLDGLEALPRPSRDARVTRFCRELRDIVAAEYFFEALELAPSVGPAFAKSLLVLASDDQRQNLDRAIRRDARLSCWLGSTGAGNEERAALPPENLAAVVRMSFGEIMKARDPSVKARSLRWLAPHIGDSIGLEGAAVYEASTLPAPDRATAYAGLAPALSHEQLQEALGAEVRIGDRCEVAMALSSLARHAEPVDQRSAVEQAYTVARELNVDSCIEALDPILPLLSKDAIYDLLRSAMAESCPDDNIRTLAPFLSAEHLEQAIDLTEQVNDSKYRAWAKAALAGYLPEGRRDEVFQEAISLASDCENLNDARNLLRGIGLYISGPQAMVWFDAVLRELPAKSSYLVAFSSILDRAPDEIGHRLIRLASFSDTDERLAILADFARLLDPSELRDLSRAITGWCNATVRVQLLTKLVPVVIDDGRRELVDQLLGYCVDVREGGFDFDCLVAIGPYLLADQQARAMKIAGDILDEQQRAAAIARLGAHVEPELRNTHFRSATGIALSIHSDAKCMDTLISILAFAPEAMRGQLMAATLNRASTSHRGHVLRALAAFADDVARLGGAGVIADVRQSILDARSWYP